MRRSSPLAMALGSLSIVASCAVLPAAPSPAPAPSVGEAPRLLAATPAPRASASPSPSPTPSPPSSPTVWWRGDLIQFEARRVPGGDRDIFIYNSELDTVLAVVGANTPDDESSPKLSSDRRRLAFQRTPAGGDADILMLDTRTQLLDTLKGLNSEAFDETNPDLSGDGRWIAYVFSDDGGDTSHLRLYDVELDVSYDFPAVDRAFVTVGGPRLSHDNEIIGFSAAVLGPDGEPEPDDIHLYDLRYQTLQTPAFINSPFNEDNPDLNRDGVRLLFTSDRFGTRDLFEANLVTGVVSHLVFANTALYDESNPRYYGHDDVYVRFKQFPRPDDQPDDFLMRVYDPTTGNLSTLPIGNLGQLLPALFPSPAP